MRGRWEPVGRIALYSVFEINFSLFSCRNRRCICVSILAVLSLLTAGPRSRNLVVSFRIVIILSLYSFLLRITTPDPLSGFVMMNISTKFEKQITSSVKRCFFSVEPHVVFTTRQLLPPTKKDVLPSHHQNNVIYQFVCHCDSRYIGRTSQRLKERIKQHIPKSITNPPTPHIRQSLPRPGKATGPRQFHESLQSTLNSLHI